MQPQLLFEAEIENSILKLDKIDLTVYRARQLMNSLTFRWLIPFDKYFKTNA